MSDETNQAENIIITNQPDPSLTASAVAAYTQTCASLDVNFQTSIKLSEHKFQVTLSASDDFNKFLSGPSFAMAIAVGLVALSTGKSVPVQYAFSGGAFEHSDCFFAVAGLDAKLAAASNNGVYKVFLPYTNFEGGILVDDNVVDPGILSRIEITTVVNFKELFEMVFHLSVG